MLIRVRKSETQAKPVMADGLAYCLECWKYHMSGTSAVKLGAKPMGGMTGNEDGYGRDPNEAQLAQDAKVGAATNVAIDSLAKDQKWAVYSTLGMGDVVKHALADRLKHYTEATEQLIVKLRRNMDTSYLF